MWQLGEVTEHLGLVELNASGASVLADDGAGASDADDPSHGDGGIIAARPARAFSEEAYQAVRWKCRLPHLSPEALGNILQALPEWSIEEAIADYKQRSAPAKPQQKTPFLLSRDARLRDKEKAAQHFLAFCRETFGDPMDQQHLEAQTLQDAVWMVRGLQGGTCLLEKSLPENDCSGVPELLEKV